MIDRDTPPQGATLGNYLEKTHKKNVHLTELRHYRVRVLHEQNKMYLSDYYQSDLLVKPVYILKVQCVCFAKL